MSTFNDRDSLMIESGIDSDSYVSSMNDNTDFYPKNYFMPLHIGVRVFHHIFKEGIVMGVDGNFITVSFFGDIRIIHPDFLLKLPGQK